VRRDKIGFIFQFFNLLPTLSCLENVSLPLHLRGWPRKKIDERARELLDLVQLTARLEHLPTSFQAASASVWRSRVHCPFIRRFC
jgi:predicted ABC-type transport system involved in lysophospholipase L1 biosynthesis ATPase subunit